MHKGTKTDFWESLHSESETLRKISDFAEAEIVIPNGTLKNQYYSLATQPVIRHYFEAVESGRYQRFAVVGCTQSGKTLSCSVIPTLWHLFECGDDCVYGAPTLEVAKDKWTQDFHPVIEASRYKDFIPSRGIGARGGVPKAGINFLNGSSLRFMTAGGSDKTVAGYTARCITITEVDGMDMARQTSREADRVSQLEVRGDAFGMSKRVYLECTASIPEGRIWQEYLKGTHCAIEKQCPYCDEWVVPEREHIRGWENTEKERQVAECGHFVCPACEHELTSLDRVNMLFASRLRVDNPDSLTFSFRWNAFDNLFWTPGSIALDRWRAKHASEETRENAEKVQHQFKWALPYEEPKPEGDEPVIDLTNAAPIMTLRQGIVPAWAKYLTFGMDIGYKRFHWVVVAWADNATGHVVDYGVITTDWEYHGHEAAVRGALKRDMPTIIGQRWQREGGGGTLALDAGLLDSNWLPDEVRPFCTGILLPAVGVGETNSFRKLKRRYKPPEKRDKGAGRNTQIMRIGEGWHLLRRKPDGHKSFRVVEHDVDFGKSWLHKRIATPSDKPGALTFFQTLQEDAHKAFFDQLTAEIQVYKKGILTWEKVRTGNHFLDAMVLAATAARMLGVSTNEREPAPDRAVTTGGTQHSQSVNLTIKSRY